MPLYHLLLIEDDERLMAINRERLQADGYEVATASTLREAEAHLAQTPPDAIISDILLPDGSGLQFCREVRANSTIPFMFLTVLDKEEQIVEGLRSGGDDYLIKPYGLDELVARVAALLRCRHYGQDSWELHWQDTLRLNLLTRRAFCCEKDLGLTPKEFALLVALVRGGEAFLDSETLYQEIWGLAMQNDARTVMVHISTLRGKLRKAGAEHLAIQWAAGKGYRLHVRKE